METTKREPRCIAVDEAMGFVMGCYSNMTDRERDIARCAARAAVRWSKRLMAERLQEWADDEQG